MSDLLTKCYPLKMEVPLYEALKKVAHYKGITIKQALRNAIGMYMIDNVEYLRVVRPVREERKKKKKKKISPEANNNPEEINQ